MAGVPGGAQTYGAYGVTGVLELDSVREGHSTSLFLAAFSPAGDVVGGLRAQGPSSDVDEAHALAEWDREPGRSLVRAAIEDRLRYGVVESKTVWVARDIPDRRELVACFARAPMHASMILGARYAFGTAGAQVLPMWTSTGAVATDGVTTVGYPDARYRTHLLWWDRWTLPDTVPEGVRRALDLEAAQAPVARRPVGRGVTRAGAEDDGPSRAVLLEETVAEDAEVLRDLRADPAVAVVDRREAQQADLAATRVGARPGVRGGRWAYYPRRRGLVGVRSTATATRSPRPSRTGWVASGSGWWG
ncbi:MAG: hypothetical protein K0S40_1921 [Actinomycetospora sp.]|nr:hypothetical protein [Actinomycetospora sp.]